MAALDMKIGSGVEKEAGGHGQNQAADKQEGPIVGDEINEGFHAIPFVMNADGRPC